MYRLADGSDALMPKPQLPEGLCRHRVILKYLGFSDGSRACEIYSQLIVAQPLAVQVLHSSDRIFHIREIDERHIAVAHETEALDASVARKLGLQMVLAARLADASHPNGADRFTTLQPRIEARIRARTKQW